VQRDLVVTIGLDTDGEPISGWVQAAGAPPRPFVGYIDLIAALEQARHPEPDAGQTKLA